MSITKTRLAIVISHPIQYFVSLYRILSESDDLQVKVFFGSKIGITEYYDKHMGVMLKWNTDLVSGYDHEFLAEADRITKLGFFKLNNPSITKALSDFKPDVIHTHGYASLTVLRALIWGRSNNIPVMLSSDNSLLYRRPKFKEYCKKFILSKLFKSYKSILTTGNNNQAYFENYGVNASKLFLSPFVVNDVDYNKAFANKAAIQSSLKRKYDIDDDEIVLLQSGKLVPWKNPADLLDALEAALKHYNITKKLVVFFAGGGPLLKELEEKAKSAKLRVVFGGFINSKEMPDVYALADVFVMPSSKEPYGMSAREAICLGLPVIASDQVGCAGSEDVVRNGFNGLVFSAGNIDQLAEHITMIVSDDQMYTSMCKRSKEIAVGLSAQSIAGYTEAIDYSINTKN